MDRRAGCRIEVLLKASLYTWSVFWQHEDLKNQWVARLVLYTLELRMDVACSERNGV